MKLHIVSLPNTSTTRDYCWSPYTQKVRMFSKMMIELGHETYIYGGPFNDAICTEHIPCIKADQQLEWFPDRFPSFDPNSPGRRHFISTAVFAIYDRSTPGDILCLTEGSVQMELLHDFPRLIPIEIGVGYEATCTVRRVFESYAWMHTVLGAQQGAQFGHGGFLDAVIPNAFDPVDFPFGQHRGDYLLYVGRLDLRKGIEIACDVAIAANTRLFVCGTGDWNLPNHPLVEYYGPVQPELRARLMGEARALIQPTLTVEPFGNSVVEAQLCGTPVITTDWGAFVETVEDQYSGYRCRSLTEFVDAVHSLDYLYWNHSEIQAAAVDHYSTDNLKLWWAEYLERVTGGASAPLSPPKQSERE